MIATKEIQTDGHNVRQLEATDPNAVPEVLRDYLSTYLRQHNELSATYAWMSPRLSYNQKREWERTISALATVCQALEAGFDPITPPKNWSSGLLIQYLSPIPEGVRIAIDRAETIFGQDHILIYDPNEEHFRRPRVMDPLAVGFVDLAEQRLHFLVRQWDLAADLKFIEGSKRIKRAREQVQEEA